MSMIQVPLEKIDLHSWNSRVCVDGANGPNSTGQEIKSLADSMKEVGQLSPIQVIPQKDGLFRMISGFRRLCAAKLLGMKTLNAVVLDIKDESQARLVNMVDNLQRKDLTTYEIAHGCCGLRESGMTGDNIAEKLGFSGKSYVNNLIRVFNGIHPKIKELWQKGEGFCTSDWLVATCALSMDEQLEALDKARLIPENTPSGDGEDKSEDKPAKPAKPKTLKHDDIIEHLAEVAGWDIKDKNSKLIRDGVIIGLEFAIGTRTEIKLPSGDKLDLKAIAEAKEKEKRMEKVKEMEEKLALLKAGKEIPKKTKKPAKVEE